MTQPAVWCIFHQFEVILNKRNQHCGIQSKVLTKLYRSMPSFFLWHNHHHGHIPNQFLWQISFDYWSIPYHRAIMSQVNKNWRPNTYLLSHCPLHNRMTIRAWCIKMRPNKPIVKPPCPVSILKHPQTIGFGLFKTYSQWCSQSIRPYTNLWKPYCLR